MTTTVFISYSRRNEYIAQRLHADLVRAGCRVWFDQRSIPVNTIWKQQIVQGIDESAYFVYLWSPEAENSEYVMFEYDRAKKNLKTIGIAVVSGKPDHLPQYIDFVVDYESGLTEICQWMEIDPGTLESPRDLISRRVTMEVAVAKMKPDKPLKWVVDCTSEDLDGQQRDFVRMPLLAGGYCVSWLVAEERLPISPQNDLHVVLKFTDTGDIDAVQEALNYLVANHMQPHMIVVEGPRDSHGHYRLPNDCPRIWSDCIELVTKTLNRFGQGKTRHYFLHAPQALSLGIGARQRELNPYHVYNLERNSTGSADRYKRVVSGLGGT